MIACVRVLNFALRLDLLDHPERDGEPLVLSPESGERRKVIDCTPEATALYIRPGMSIRDVTAMSPAAVVIEANPAREAAASKRILGKLETLSPLVEADAQEAGCWYLDLTGLDRLLGSPPAIAQQLLALMPPMLRPRVGIAGGKFPARVAAGRATAGSFLIVDPAETKTFLAIEAIDSLPCPPEMTLLFKQLGIETLGHLAALKASAVAARFGPAGREAWGLANGISENALVVQPHQNILRERMELPAPTASRDTLLYALNLLVQRVSNQPQMTARGARQVLIRAVYENGGSWGKQIALKDPAKGARLAELLRLRFQALELPQPVVELQIELSNLSKEAARQELLNGFRTRDERPIEEANNQLNGRYTASTLFRAVGVEPWSRIPERRYSLMPYEPRPNDEPKALNMPEPIEVQSRLSPRGKPAPHALVRGANRWEVTRVEDQWCIDDEWWLRPVRRRYFNVVLENGAKRTIFHDLSDKRWYSQQY